MASLLDMRFRGRMMVIDRCIYNMRESGDNIYSSKICFHDDVDIEIS